MDNKHTILLTLVVLGALVVLTNDAYAENNTTPIYEPTLNGYVDQLIANPGTTTNSYNYNSTSMDITVEILNPSHNIYNVTTQKYINGSLTSQYSYTVRILSGDTYRVTSSDFDQTFTRVESEGTPDQYVSDDRYGILYVADSGSITTDLHDSGTTWDNKSYSVDIEVDNNRATIDWDAPLTYRWWFVEWAFSHIALNYSLMDGNLYSEQNTGTYYTNVPSASSHNFYGNFAYTLITPN